MVYKEANNATDPVDTKLWRDNFYLIPRRPPGKDYLPPLLPSKVGRLFQTLLVQSKLKTSVFLFAAISNIIYPFLTLIE